MVRALDQQTSQVHVASLRDAELRVAVPRLAASWPQAEVTTDIATSLEALFASQGQHVSSRDVANAVDLQ